MTEFRLKLKDTNGKELESTQAIILGIVFILNLLLGAWLVMLLVPFFNFHLAYRECAAIWVMFRFILQPPIKGNT